MLVLREDQKAAAVWSVDGGGMGGHSCCLGFKGWPLFVTVKQSKWDLVAHKHA